MGIILKRHIESFSELIDKEIQELGKLIKISQKILDAEFKPDWYNIQKNANWHHHMHFLVLPRYRKSMKLIGKTYIDKTFGEPILYTKKKESEEFLKVLTNNLVRHL